MRPTLPNSGRWTLVYLCAGLYAAESGEMLAAMRNHDRRRAVLNAVDSENR
jgi:hypothetical protein